MLQGVWLHALAPEPLLGLWATKRSAALVSPPEVRLSGSHSDRLRLSERLQERGYTAFGG